MALSAQFAATPNLGMVRIAGAGAANTARDGSGVEGTTIFKLCDAGASGSRIDRIIINACGSLNATTAGMIRLFISDGVSKKLYREIPVTVVTPSASAAGFNNYSSSAIDGGLFLEPGQSLWVTSHMADTLGNQFDILAIGGDF
jgi:hypothetical protein